MKRLKTEEELMRKLLANSDGKVSISPRAFKEEAISSNTATVVEMLVENTSSHFKQYCDSFYALYYKVSDEYKKWVSGENNKVIESVERIKEQVGEEKSKNVESSEELESTESSENSEYSMSYEISEYLENQEKSSRKSERTKYVVVEFDLDMESFHRSDREKIRNFSKYCLKLSNSLLQFKRRFARLPLNFSAVQYKVWKQKVSHVFHSKIQAYPSQFKLVDQIATSDKMEAYLKTACELTTNLVMDLPSLCSEDIDDKRRLVGIFASTCKVMSTLLMKLCESLYKIADMRKKGGTAFVTCKDLLRFYLIEIYNLVRWFKKDLEEDLPHRQDVIQWADDLRDFIFEMYCCKLL